FQKTCCELGTTIRNDRFRYAMQANNAIEINLSISLGIIGGVHWDEMSRLCKSIHDNPNGVVLLGCVWQSNNEIHTYVFPFPRWDRKRLKQTGYSQVAGFYSLTVSHS